MKKVKKMPKTHITISIDPDLAIFLQNNYKGQISHLVETYLLTLATTEIDEDWYDMHPAELKKIVEETELERKKTIHEIKKLKQKLSILQTKNHHNTQQMQNTTNTKQPTRKKKTSLYLDEELFEQAKKCFKKKPSEIVETMLREKLQKIGALNTDVEIMTEEEYLQDQLNKTIAKKNELNKKLQATKALYQKKEEERKRKAEERFQEIKLQMESLKASRMQVWR